MCQDWAAEARCPLFFRSMKVLHFAHKFNPAVDISRREHEFKKDVFQRGHTLLSVGLKPKSLFTMHWRLYPHIQILTILLSEHKLTAG